MRMFSTQLVAAAQRFRRCAAHLEPMRTGSSSIRFVKTSAGGGSGGGNTARAGSASRLPSVKAFSREKQGRWSEILWPPRAKAEAFPAPIGRFTTAGEAVRNALYLAGRLLGQQKAKGLRPPRQDTKQHARRSNEPGRQRRAQDQPPTEAQGWCVSVGRRHAVLPPRAARNAELLRAQTQLSPFCWCRWSRGRRDWERGGEQPSQLLCQRNPQRDAPLCAERMHLSVASCLFRTFAAAWAVDTWDDYVGFLPDSPAPPKLVALCVAPSPGAGCSVSRSQWAEPGRSLLSAQPRSSAPESAFEPSHPLPTVSRSAVSSR